MKEEPMILKRGRLTYLLFAEKVIVGVGSQWVSYNQYDNWNRQGIAKFKEILMKSKEDEYDNAVDQMSLAVQCGIRGAATRKPERIV